MVVKIKFKSAKIILNKKKLQDVIFDMDAIINKSGVRDRTHGNYFSDAKIAEQPFEMEQVSNLLHVLFGQRPVPTHQSTIRRRLPFIDDIAKTAWFRIENLYYYRNKSGKPIYITSFGQGKKVKPTANRQEADINTIGGDGHVYAGSIITWSTFAQKYYLSNREKYDKVMHKFEELYGSKNFSRDYALVDLIHYLVNVKGCGDELTEFFKINKLDPLQSVVKRNEICKGFNNVSAIYNSNLDFSYRPVNVQLLYKVTLHGSIIVDVPDELVETLFNGNRFATFLESGMAELVDAQWGSVKSVGENEGYRLLCM